MLIIMLIKRRKNPLYTLWEFNGSSFEQICIPLIQGCIVPSSVEISPAVLEKKIFKFCQCIFTISLLSPIEKSFEQNWVLITQGCIVPSLVEISLVVLEKKIFLILSMYFLLFHNYLPLEKGGALYLNKLESPSPKDALCQAWFWRRNRK